MSESRIKTILNGRPYLLLKSGVSLCVLFLLSSLPVCGQSKKSDSFFGKGVELYREGLYSEAIGCFERVVELDSKEIPAGSERSGYGSDWLASCYYKLGDTVKASEIAPYSYRLEPVDRRLTIASDIEADSAVQCQRKGQFEKAVRHAEKCLELEKLTLGENSLHCVGTYLILGDFYSQLEDNDNALINYNNGLIILYSNGIEDSIYNFNLLRGKVYVYLSNNDTQSALADTKKMEKILDCEGNENKDDYSIASMDLLYARIYVQSQDYDSARIHAEKSFKKLLDIYSPKREDIVTDLDECITMMIASSQFDKAILLLREAIDRENLSEAHRGVFMSCLAECTGDMDLCQQSLDLLRDSEYVGPYNSTRCLQAAIYDGNGDVLQAIGVLNQVCNYYEQKDPESPIHRRALMMLGDIYQRQGDYYRSNECYSKILSLLKDYKDSPDYILTFMKWIPVYANYSFYGGTSDGKNGFSEGNEIGKELSRLIANISFNDFLNEGIGLEVVANVTIDFFEAMLQHAVMTPMISWSDMEQILSQLTYEYLIPMCSENAVIAHRAKAALAHTKYIRGNYGEAINLMKEIISSCKMINLPYENYLHDLAYYQYDSGDKQGAYENFRIGYDFLKNNILSGYRWMTIDERENLTRASRGNLDNIPHYAAITPEDSRYAELGYNALLFTKGMLLNSTVELSRLIQETGDAEALNLLNTWRRLNQECLTSRQKGNEIKAGNLKRQADAIERQLLDTSKCYGDYTDGLTVDYRDVQNGLGDGDVALEFFSYQYDARSRMYGALILTKNDGPRYIPLGRDSEWGAIDQGCYADDKLFNTLFSNLRQQLPDKDKGNVYFAADGLLHTIAIENLPGAESYGFRRLSSTREIALRREGVDSISDIVVFGGVKYGVGKLSEYYKENDAGNRESLEFLAYLPGTKVEADKIEALFSQKMKVTRYAEDKATETCFKNLSGKRTGLLHIGTHGFFNTPSSLNNQAKYEADAMESAGLCFAGAQNTIWGEPARGMKDDGILTAREISTLDLRGLRLVVLSACETGKGSIGPDGVFGLQRGFKQAGAEGLVMTLWKVDDKATQMLMENFYLNLYNGQDAYTSFRSAQDTVRKAYPDPKYWAAFIMVDANKKLKF